MSYREFDRSRLEIRPLAERVHELDIGAVIDPDGLSPKVSESEWVRLLAKRLLEARAVRKETDGTEGAVVLAAGAHVLRRGLGPILIRLMEQRLVHHVAMNGAGPIHEWELARIGATTESVARYIDNGQFGLWRETGELNDVIRDGAREGRGLGEAVGRALALSDFPYVHVSVLAAGWRLGVPVTVHVGIGYDIIHEHPNCDGAALGATSYRDFLRFAASVEGLERGVFVCAGTAVMGPEVFLKALAMARNVARQEGRDIRNFTTTVIDIQPLPEGRPGGEPERARPEYYFRPLKTVLVRTVAGGGDGFYIRGDHQRVFVDLYRTLKAFGGL